MQAELITFQSILQYFMACTNTDINIDTLVSLIRVLCLGYFFSPDIMTETMTCLN